VWFADLVHLGFTQTKSSTLTFPTVPKQYQADFVRGYFDGDGCMYVNKLKYADRTHKRWAVLSLFTSGSRGFLLQLHNLLKKHGVKGGSLVRKTRGYELKFSHNDSIALYRFMYHTRPVLAQLPRKRKKFELAMKILKYKMRL
jgi:intein-encoded DNA endonuclease-like protein